MYSVLHKQSVPATFIQEILSTLIHCINRPREVLDVACFPAVQQFEHLGTEIAH